MWHPAQPRFETPGPWERLAARFRDTYRYGPAITCLERALALRVRALGRAHPDTIATRVALARLHAQLARELSITGEEGRARDLFVSASRLCGEDAACAAQVTHDLGVLHLVRRDAQGAERAFRAAHANMSSIGEEYLATLLWVRAASGRQLAAEEMLRTARATHAQAGQPAQRALEALATSLEATRAAHEGPLAHLQRTVVQHAHAGGQSIELADALHALSDAHAARGSFDQARALLAHALILRRNTLGEMHPAIARTLNAISLLLAARGDIESALKVRDYTRLLMHAALESLLGSSSEEEIMRHLGNLRADTDALVSLHLGMAPDRPEAAHLVFDSLLRDKSRALDVIAARTAVLRMHSRERIRSYFGDWQPGLFTWETQRRQRQERAITALEELRRLRAELAGHVYRGGDPRETARLERRIGVLEREVIELVGTRRIGLYTSPAMVQRRLPESGAMLELVRYQPFDFRTWTSGAPRYAAYVLRAGGPPSGIDLGLASEIDARVHELRQAILLRRPQEDGRGRPTIEAPRQPYAAALPGNRRRAAGGCAVSRGLALGPLLWPRPESHDGRPGRESGAQSTPERARPSHLGPDGSPRCGTPETPIPGCVPLNLFDGVGTITPAMLRYVGYTGIESGDNTLHQALFTASGRLLGNRGGRRLSLAVGAEYQRHGGSRLPDSVVALDDAIGLGAASTVKGDYDARETYAELSLIPIAGSPVARHLELIGAVRFSDFTTEAFATWQARGAWQSPFGLSLRGGYHRMFRSPNLADLYAPVSEGFVSLRDPCDPGNVPGFDYARTNCAADGLPADFADRRSQLYVRSGGNRDLAREQATALTLGAAYHPPFIPGLGLELGYFHLVMNNHMQSHRRGRHPSELLRGGP